LQHAKAEHNKPGKYARVADHLYRYSATKKYYAVFKCNRKTKWVALNTTDWELAGRRLKDEIGKHKRTDPKTSTMGWKPCWPYTRNQCKV